MNTNEVENISKQVIYLLQKYQALNEVLMKKLDIATKAMKGSADSKIISALIEMNKLDQEYADKLLGKK